MIVHVVDLAYSSNYAAVSADTFSSELGILSKSKPRLLTSKDFREVPPGTNGGITLMGTLAGFLGAFIIAVTSATLLPFCPLGLSSKAGHVFGQSQLGIQGEGWGWLEKFQWIIAVTLWGGLGSLLDSALGGWLQASVVDIRTGKIVEGAGGKKVNFKRYDTEYADPLSRFSLSGLTQALVREPMSQVAKLRVV